MSTAATPVYEWRTIDWKQCQKVVSKLQTRIYRASRRGDVAAVHKLQRLLVTSRSAKLLAVRRVTQDNRGKRTAGVDGVKALTPPQRLALAATLTLPTKASPLRRVWLPKPGTTEQRPLGIPTIRDRAAQALLKLALEPEWEARFEPNSYGFRPGRSAHDAIEAVFTGVCHRPKYVLDADIAKCFDRINQAALLAKLNTTPVFRRAIRAWLQAGVMEGPTLFPTKEGTPQGGVLSPLLANVALHGLETAIRTAFPTGVAVKGKWQGHWQPIVVRYADDFVVLHPDAAAIDQVQHTAAAWLRGMGLELKPSKTRIVHTLQEHQGEPPGFNFLGVTVRQFLVRQRRAGGTPRGNRLAFKTLIKPSNEGRKRHHRQLGQLVRAHHGKSQAVLIYRLNPVIRGWCNYYSTVVSKRVFSKEDYLLYTQLRSWARRRHQGRSVKRLVRKYWRFTTRSWVFASGDGHALYQHCQTPIRRHVKVQGERSPFDGNWSYWTSRLKRHPGWTPREAWLLRRQAGRCQWCGLLFTDGDVWEVDHIVPRSHGGSDTYENLQLLHQHCHDQKTEADRAAPILAS